MTRIEVLNFAFDGALAKWSTAKRRLDAFPDSEIAKAKEQQAFEQLNEISALLYDAEHEND